MVIGLCGPDNQLNRGVHPWFHCVLSLQNSQHKDSQLVPRARSFGKTGGVYILIVQTWHLLRWRDGGVLCVVRAETDEVIAEK